MLTSLKTNLISLIMLTIIIANCSLCIHGLTFEPLLTKTANPVYDSYQNATKYPGEICNRACVKDVNRICYFKFTLEYFQAMGIACGNCGNEGAENDCNHPQCVVGDGTKKGVMSINRRIPGPDIQVCKDDIVIVDVVNKADGTAASIHWHGVHMVETPYMDGVPFVTQCPIAYSNTFRYQFRATEPGTQFYHSHSGHHKANGQYGALIIRQPKNLEPYRDSFDFDLPEHYILITDWMHVMAEQFYPGLNTPEGIFANSLTINGRGVHSNPTTLNRTRVPPTIYYVEPGKRFRFRLINSINHACPVQLQIENHNFEIIATDSYDVVPDVFDTLVSNAGERYDFILTANHTRGDFWLRARGFGTCLDRPTESFALIRYRTNESVNSSNNLQFSEFPLYNETYPSFIFINHPNASCWTNRKNRCITELMSLQQDTLLRSAEPHRKFFLAFDNYVVPNSEIFNNTEYEHFGNLAGSTTAVGAINNLSLVFPDYAPLTQPQNIDETQFCDSGRRPARCAGKRLCHCIHRLKVELNSVVELIIVDETANVNPINHPFHLHGYRFMVTGMGQHPLGIPMSIRRAQKLENDRLLPRDTLHTRPAFKDTVSVPSRGYVIIRLRATNPGFWLMHCHYEWHLSIGMGLILQVGEPKQMVPPPKGFPICGNHIPGDKQSENKSTRKPKSTMETISTKFNQVLGRIDAIGGLLLKQII